MTQEEFSNPGDVLLEKCEIESITGDTFNIIDIVSEINIYEDLFSNGVSGDLFVVDSVNLISNAPIIGQEKIRIKFKTPIIDPDNPRELTFQIYKISKRKRKNDRTQGYILYFVSPSTIKNQLTKISKTLSGKISDMIAPITQDVLGSDLFNVETTKGSFEFVIPYWSPFKTLNWLAKRAITGETLGVDANFVFFETISPDNQKTENGLSHHFMSIGELMSPEGGGIGNRTHTKYKFGAVNRTSQETGKEMYPDLQSTYYTINDYEILESMDTMEAVSNGMYASRLINYDVVTKKITNSTFSYWDSFQNDTRNIQSMEETVSHPLTTDKNNPSGFKLHDFPDSNITRMDEHAKSHDGYTKPYGSEGYILQRRSSLQQLKMNRMRCVIPGNSLLRVGNVFDIHLPSQEEQSNLGLEDPRLSGRYLITSLRHRIQKGSYFTYLELSKNSFYNRLPETTR